MEHRDGPKISEVTEEFLKREHTTEFDAIHPRFFQQDEAQLRRYEEENYYYCQECNEFFAPTVVGLNTHFSGDMVIHKPMGSCFYCRGRVYEYYKNNTRKIYHNCSDRDKLC